MAWHKSFKKTNRLADVVVPLLKFDPNSFHGIASAALASQGVTVRFGKLMGPKRSGIAFVFNCRANIHIALSSAFSSPYIPP